MEQLTQNSMSTTAPPKTVYKIQSDTVNLGPLLFLLARQPDYSEAKAAAIMMVAQECEANGCDMITTLRKIKEISNQPANIATA